MENQRPGTIDAARVALLIATEYPREQQPEQLAEALISAAGQAERELLLLLLWLTDRPRHELSVPAFLRWRDRYTAPAGEEAAYQAGYDAAKNGANTTNCHHRFFSRMELTRR